MLAPYQKRLKRSFDLIFSIVVVCLGIVPMLIFVCIATFSTRSFGMFFQKRIGKNGIPFIMFKIKSMRIDSKGNLTVTPFGKLLRKSKFDELPQIFNVIIGDMSVVGPRPDIVGYADKLTGDDRIILTVKPGITGPATLHFSDEEFVLSKQDNPQNYNDTVLWPQKVAMNKKYVENWSFLTDLGYVIKTVKQLFR